MKLRKYFVIRSAKFFLPKNKKKYTNKREKIGKKINLISSQKNIFCLYIYFGSGFWIPLS
jgi:hypothetical protein